DHAPQHRRVQRRAEEAHDADREGEGGPVAHPVPDHEHVADEGAQHQQVALGEVDQLGGLVDEDEAEGDEAVDAPDGEAVQGELQDGVQNDPPAPVAGTPPAAATLSRRDGNGGGYSRAAPANANLP